MDAEAEFDQVPGTVDWTVSREGEDVGRYDDLAKAVKAYCEATSE